MDPTAPVDERPAGRNGWRWFLAGWTVIALGIVALLWYSNQAGLQEQVFVLHDDESSREGFWEAVRRTLLLAHLSLSRAYPWVLLAPFVLWAASRFSLEREHLRRHLIFQGLLAALFVAACQQLHQRVTGGQPTRVIVAVTETSTSGTNADGAPGEWGRRLRREMRVSTMEPPGEHPSGAGVYRGIDTDRDQPAGLVPFGPGPGEGLAGWTSAVPGAHDPGFRFGLFWRGRVLSAALDLSVFLSLCGLGHAVHFRRRFQERERRAAALESSLARARLHTLQAQLQPHFLFNTLNSITAMVRQNPAGAEEMLTSLGDLLRLALSGANRPWSTVREELHFLQLYLDIQQTRFGDRLRFAQEIDPAALDCAIPGLLLQPLVENAVRHGIEPANRPGKVRVAAHVRGDVLELSVEDDGVGCPHLLDGSARFGVGLGNVREQLAALFGQGARLTFAGGTAGGLAVHIQLPVRRPAPERETTPDDAALPHC